VIRPDHPTTDFVLAGRLGRVSAGVRRTNFSGCKEPESKAAPKRQPTATKVADGGVLGACRIPVVLGAGIGSRAASKTFPSFPYGGLGRGVDTRPTGHRWSALEGASAGRSGREHGWVTPGLRRGDSGGKGERKADGAPTVLDGGTGRAERPAGRVPPF